MTNNFYTTFNFIKTSYPDRIFKNNQGQTPRVRFEAISVGTNLALQKNPNLKINNIKIQKMVDSVKFKKYTTSDGANTHNMVTKRIEFVRDYLLNNKD